MTALVVLTQAAEGSDSLAQQLLAAGLQVERWPLVRLAPVAEEIIRPVLQRLADYDWIFLPSPSAVRLVAQRMKAFGIAWPPGSRAGLIGPASVEAFRDCFGEEPLVDTPPTPPHDTRHLVDLMGVAQAPAGEAPLPPPAKALVLNRPDGRVDWLETLRRKAGSVDVVAAYTAQALAEPPPQELMWRLQRMQRAGGRVLWVAGASSQLDTLLKALPAELVDWAKHQPVLVPHDAILAHAQALGFDNGERYNDRRDLVERLQYLGNGAVRAPLDAADKDADKQGISVLSLDQQKPSAIPGAAKDDDHGRDATPSAPATITTAPAQSPAGATASTTSPAPSAPASVAAVSSSAPSVSVPSSPATSASKPSSASLPPSASSPPSAGSPSSASSPPPVSLPPSASPAPFGSPPPRMPEPPAPLPPAPRPPAGGVRRSGGLWALPVLLLVCLLGALGWWYVQQRFLEAERDGARRVQEADARAGRLEEQIKTLRDAQGQLLSRSSTLETRIAESASQQEQLASLYDEIAKTRGDSTLAEVEQSMLMANQHLELTGNVQAALLALQNAERRLGDSEQSQAIGARRLILQDIERLKSLPEVDVTRSAARLDEIINRIDRLPLLADAAEAAAAPAPMQQPARDANQQLPPDAGQQPAPAVAAADADTAPSATAPAGTPPASAPAPMPPAAEGTQPSALQRIYSSLVEGGARSLDAVRDEFRSLVTIRRIDKPDSLLLSPEQKHAARENLKLQLLNARLNLLNRNEELFRRDLGRVIEAMQRLFDTEQHDVKTALAALQSLQVQPLALNLPSLAESLAAVRAARAASEKRS